MGLGIKKQEMVRLVVFCLSMLPLMAVAVEETRNEAGTPFFVNYTADVYGAHDRNEAVVCDGKGICYFANYEGVLRYNGQGWNLITTPGISRVTALTIGKDGRIYAGGYNVAGELRETGNDGMEFLTCLSDAAKEVKKIGEVRSILEGNGGVLYIARKALVWLEKDSVKVLENGVEYVRGFCVRDRMFVVDTDGRFWEFKAGKVLPATGLAIPDLVCSGMYGLPDGRILVGTNGGLFMLTGNSLERVQMDGLPPEIVVNEIAGVGEGIVIVATATHGVIFVDMNMHRVRRLDESRGLCSNVVNGVAMDGCGGIWLATGRGVARVLMPSMYSFFTEREGLNGEVLSVKRWKGRIYVGTYRGLFYLLGDRFVKMDAIRQACWQLSVGSEGDLWASTGGGLFRVSNRGVVPYGEYFTMSRAEIPGKAGSFYSGEQDAVYLNRLENGRIFREKYAAPGQVNQMLADCCGCMWMTTIFGEVYREVVTGSGKEMKEVKGLKNTLGNRIVDAGEDIWIASGDGFYRGVSGDSTEKFQLLKDSVGNNWWPGICVKDEGGRLWLTGGDGKQVTVVKDGVFLPEYVRKLKMVDGYNIRVIYPENDNMVWMGGSFGLVRMDLHRTDWAYRAVSAVYIRKVVRSSVNPRNISFVLASDVPGIIKPVRYSYRLDGFESAWSEWQKSGEVSYMRLPPGKYGFEVRSEDGFGKVSETRRFDFTVPTPFYARWYAWGIYVVFVVAGIAAVIGWRTRKLIREKERLENTVMLRTQEISKQRDEIRKKSESLEQTLTELNKTQNELIRQEKMATVGKLTQGLVDRILNPLNYIGNFALLSRNLATEAIGIVETVKEDINPEIKEDLTEVLGMLSENLLKISGHGESTAHVLKAMEELLKERKCILLPLDMEVLCRENLEFFKAYYLREITEAKVKLVLDEPEQKVVASVDAGQAGKVLLSILTNGLFALQKKLQKGAYEPELFLGIGLEQDWAVVTVRDNGIGIEQKVVEKIFDPFFTTRTTVEATGVGLYLSREIILNHGGKISVASQRGKGTEMKIYLPVYQGNLGEITIN